jgi:hypothetical protein
MKHPDFGDVLKIGTWFLKMLSVSYVLQEFKIQLKFSGYFTGHHWGSPTVFM